MSGESKYTHRLVCGVHMPPACMMIQTPEADRFSMGSHACKRGKQKQTTLPEKVILKSI